MAFRRYRGSRDNRSNTSSISYGPLLSTGASILSWATWRSSSVRRCKGLSAEHFGGSILNPSGVLQRNSQAAGKKIYEEGAPDAGVPPCAVCHGPEAKGNGPFPRLAGQPYDYILNKLANWNQERGQDPAKQDTSAIMQPIAHSLTRHKWKPSRPISIIWSKPFNLLQIIRPPALGHGAFNRTGRDGPFCIQPANGGLCLSPYP